MAGRVEALANPRLLQWARKESGLDLGAAAKKVAVKVERLASWESGGRRPTIVQLRNLARVYKRPIAVFYLPEPPADLDFPKDFRRLPGQIAETESSQLRFEIRKAITRRQIALDLMSEEGEEPSAFELQGNLSESPESLGSRIRGTLRIEPDTQFSWRGHYDPFNGWRASIEELGALVMQMTDVEKEEARGFSVSEFPLPAIVVNIKDPPVARTFSLLHELAHLVIRQGGLCDLDDTAVRSPDDLRIERFCNAVAGATLVPEFLLKTEAIVREHGSGAVWKDQDLSLLAHRFSVSREVIVRRLLDTDRTTQAFYSEKRRQFLEEHRERDRGREGGFAPPHQVALASAGTAFTGLVLSSYAHGHITASDVSDYLDIRLKHLPRIEEQLLSQGRFR